MNKKSVNLLNLRCFGLLLMVIVAFALAKPATAQAASYKSGDIGQYGELETVVSGITFSVKDNVLSATKDGATSIIHNGNESGLPVYQGCSILTDGKTIYVAYKTGQTEDSEKVQWNIFRTTLAGEETNYYKTTVSCSVEFELINYYKDKILYYQYEVADGKEIKFLDLKTKKAKSTGIYDSSGDASYADDTWFDYTGYIWHRSYSNGKLTFYNLATAKKSTVVKNYTTHLVRKGTKVYYVVLQSKYKSYYKKILSKKNKKAVKVDIYRINVNNKSKKKVVKNLTLKNIKKFTSSKITYTDSKGKSKSKSFK